MTKKEEISQNASPYEFYGKLLMSKAIPLGLQHVMAMFVGDLTPILIIMGACGMTADAGTWRSSRYDVCIHRGFRYSVDY